MRNLALFFFLLFVPALAGAQDQASPCGDFEELEKTAFKSKLTEEQRTALMVPKAAVLSEGEVSVVLAVREGKAYRINLDPGLELEAWVECRNRGDDGLHDGDLVIVSGHEDLRDQAPVEVVE